MQTVEGVISFSEAVRRAANWLGQIGCPEDSQVVRNCKSLLKQVLVLEEAGYLRASLQDEDPVDVGSIFCVLGRLGNQAFLDFANAKTREQFTVCRSISHLHNVKRSLISNLQQANRGESE